MSDLFVLIDPNDENLEALIKEVNSLKPRNVWVGCSVSSGDDILRVFEHLDFPADLYPGNFDQIRKGHTLAKRIYIPDPLFYSNPQVKTLFEKVSAYAEAEFPDRCEYMNYVLLSPNCTAAQVLGVADSFDDKTVLRSLREAKVHPYIYLEGGSRNMAYSVADRSGLVNKVKQAHPGSNVICGGGISNLHQVSLLKGLGVSILVSNAVHKNPKLLAKFMGLF